MNWISVTPLWFRFCFCGFGVCGVFVCLLVCVLFCFVVWFLLVSVSVLCWCFRQNAGLCIGPFPVHFMRLLIWRQPAYAVINQLILLRYAFEHVERPGESHEGVGRKKSCLPSNELGEWRILAGHLPLPYVTVLVTGARAHMVRRKSGWGICVLPFVFGLFFGCGDSPSCMWPPASM